MLIRNTRKNRTFQFFTELSPRGKGRIPPPVESVADRFYIVQVDMFWLDDKTSPEDRAGVVIDVNEEEHLSCSRRARRRWKCMKKMLSKKKKSPLPMDIENWTIDVETTRKTYYFERVRVVCFSSFKVSLSHHAMFRFQRFYQYRFHPLSYFLVLFDVTVVNSNSALYSYLRIFLLQFIDSLFWYNDPSVCILLILIILIVSTVQSHIFMNVI